MWNLRLSVGFVGDNMTDIRCRIGFPEDILEKAHLVRMMVLPTLFSCAKKCWKGHTCVKKNVHVHTMGSTPKILNPSQGHWCMPIASGSRFWWWNHTKSAFWCFNAGWSDQHKGKSKLQPQFGGLKIWKWSNKIVLLLFFCRDGACSCELPHLNNSYESNH